MTLIDAIRQAETLDPEATIYASEPWTENTEVIVTVESPTGDLPDAAVEMAMVYFLEVSVVHDLLEDMRRSSELVTPQQKCKRIIDYATNDA